MRRKIVLVKPADIDVAAVRLIGPCDPARQKPADMRFELVPAELFDPDTQRIETVRKGLELTLLPGPRNRQRAAPNEKPVAFQKWARSRG